MYLKRMDCCGIMELGSVSIHTQPNEVLKDMCRKVYYQDEMPQWERRNMYHGINERFRYAIFSQAASRAKYGSKLEKFIEDHKLGTVIKTGRHINPNSRHVLQVFVWTVDHKALKGWYDKEYRNGMGSKGKESTEVSGVRGTAVADGIRAVEPCPVVPTTEGDRFDPPIVGPATVGGPDTAWRQVAFSYPANCVHIDNIATTDTRPINNQFDPEP